MEKALVEKKLRKLIQETIAEERTIEKLEKVVNTIITLLNHNIEDEEVVNLSEKVKSALVALIRLEEDEEEEEKGLSKNLHDHIGEELVKKYQLDKEEEDLLKKLENLVEKVEREGGDKEKVIEMLRIVFKMLNQYEEKEKKLVGKLSKG